MNFLPFELFFRMAIAFWIDYATNKIDSPQQWRIPLWLQIVPALILG